MGTTGYVLVTDGIKQTPAAGAVGIIGTLLSVVSARKQGDVSLPVTTVGTGVVSSH